MAGMRSQGSSASPLLVALVLFAAIFGLSLLLDGWLFGFDWLRSAPGVRHQLWHGVLLLLAALGLAILIAREQRLTREILADQQEEAIRWRILYETSPIAKFIWDPASGEILSANASARALFQFPASDPSTIVGTIYDIRPPEDRTRLWSEFARVGGGAYESVYTYLRRDGSRFAARVFAHDIRIDGRDARLVYVHDLSGEQARLEAARHEADRRMREIVERISEGFLVLGPDGRVTFANQPGAAFLGYADPESALTGPPLADPALLLLASRVAATGTAERTEVTRDDGTRSYEVRLFPVPAGVGAVVAETTAQRRLQRDLERARDHALAAVRAKSEFLAVMSHELRTPLNSVLGFSELLHDTQLDDEQADYVAMVRSNGRILLDLIEEILDFSKMEAGKYRLAYAPFGFVDAVHEAAARVEALAAVKGLRLRVDVAEGVPEGVVGDELSVLKILGNLLGNAIKFTARGGVTLAVRTVDAPEGDDRAWVRLTVADTGIGIPEAVRSQLFEPFVQASAGTRRQYGGTGLGLAICRRLASQMGGRIWLDESAGPGATFHVELPFVPSSLDLASSSRTPEPWPIHFAEDHPLRILVADDVPSNQRLLDEWLRRLGYVPVLAADGQTALDLLRGESFDLVLLDVSMPGVDGPDILAEWSRSDPRARARTFVAAVTATVEEGAAERFRKLGFDAYLPKPVRKDDLLGVIRSALK